MSYYTPPRSGMHGHPAIASLCAGPILLAVLALHALAFERFAPATLGGIALAMLPGVAVGFIVSIVPNLLATFTLHALGRVNEATRLPVFWALSGAILAGALPLALGAPPEVSALLAATGTGCALVCRSGATWT